MKRCVNDFKHTVETVYVKQLDIYGIQVSPGGRVSLLISPSLKLVFDSFLLPSTVLLDTLSDSAILFLKRTQRGDDNSLTNAHFLHLSTVSAPQYGLALSPLPLAPLVEANVHHYNVCFRNSLQGVPQ